MNGTIFREYLYWFNARMVNRKVILLIDGFSAHESGLQLIETEGGLSNVCPMLKFYFYHRIQQASVSH